MKIARPERITAGTAATIVTMILIILFAQSYFAFFFNQAERILYGVKPGVTVEGQSLCGLLTDEVWRYVAQKAVECRIKPQNASIDQKTGKIIPEVSGMIVDLEKTVGLIMGAGKGEAVPLVVIEVRALYDQKLLTEITERIGGYYTNIAGSENRLFNIRLAAATINNTLVYPGEIFSFNKVVGPRTAERGYRDAPVIIGGGMALAEGGGICQVSSTLYNAAVQARMEIVERHPHSRPIHYVPPGQDAAVAYEYLDLKFRNNFISPVLLRSNVYGRRIEINFLGHRPEEE